MPTSRRRRRKSTQQSTSAVRRKTASNSASNLTKKGLEALRVRRFAEAATAFQTALQRSPKAWQLYNLLGVALRGDRKLADAIGTFQRGIALRPNEPTLHNNLGNVLRDLGRHDESIRHFEEAIRLDPNYAEAHHNVALSLEQLERTEEAERHCARAVELKPGYVEALFGLSRIRLLRRNFEGAEVAISRAIELAPNRADLRLCRASILRGRGRLPEAEAPSVQVTERAPDLAEGHLAKGAAMMAKGDHAGARDLFRRALVLRPDSPEPYIELLAAGGALTESELLAARERAQRKDIPRDLRASLCLVVAQDLDRRQDYDRAFFWARKAKELERFGSRYSDADARDFVQRSILTFNERVFEQRGGSMSDRPVFIVGFTQSGTSLVERLVASHPLVAAGGELAEIPNLIRSLSGIYPDCVASLPHETLERLAGQYLRCLDEADQKAVRVTDKRTFNFRHLGFIARLFPEAHVIHCRRDPRDVAISAYLSEVPRPGSFTQSFYDFAQFWRKYERLMQHWRTSLPVRILDVDYEALVSQPEREGARILQGLGLPWDDSCLQFHEATRAVPSASVDQVGDAKNAGSIGRWRNYAKHLMPLYYELERGEAAFET